MRPTKNSLASAENLLRFIDKSPTPFHAVAEMKKLLVHVGFRVLAENDSWKLEKGGCYIVTRNDSTLAAFMVGSEPLPQSGFRIIGAHSDSPNLRLKPNPVYDKNGFMQFGIEPYGGVLLASWLNRDLSIAGRVIVRSKNGTLLPKYVMLREPVVSIPQLAIHLNPKVNDEGLIVNKQTHLPPLVALTDTEISSADRLHKLLQENLGLSSKESIIGTDLSLYDTLPSSLGGIDQEFVYAPRLDNLASCHAGITALAATVDPICSCVVVCYDNEEVGSLTAQGAQSSFLRDVLERIAFATSAERTSENLRRAIACSLCISADMAHAVHPNYADKHDPHHMPLIGRGPVIKTNVNQRYASDARSSAYFMELCRQAGISYQQFVSRSDLACGTTIGPITAAELGVCTVDVGNPMLSMHSVREQAGVADHIAMIDVFSKFFDKVTSNLLIG
ncbi:MAG: M18 family aminopeptidase [Candidatus Sungbacteria bacterium]|nr:M18 family aminopeptidase [Candidatus Sungbacteria bacterium]